MWLSGYLLVPAAMLFAGVQYSTEGLVPSGFVELSSGDIRQALSGRTLMPDPDLRQMVVPYGESFQDDGRWHGWRDERGRRTNSGGWRVELGQVCVIVDDGNRSPPGMPHEDCRKVWRNAQTGRLMMIDREAPAPYRQPLMLVSRPNGFPNYH